jgi:ubiquinone/menaquinone biosynthesis C-methylase UbiE
MTLYDQLADQYADLTDSARRRELADDFADRLLSQYSIDSVLDAATGTGVYGLALAKRGVRVLGTDISSAMLDQAARDARKENLQVTWLQAPMQRLGRDVTGSYDAILCMGNSLPHLVSQADLEAALTSFASLLSKSGILVLQVLNYARILAERQRIVDINRSGDREYIRFYDFEPSVLQFNVLAVDWSQDPPSHELHSTTLRPYVIDEISTALKRSGFEIEGTHGGLDFSPFDPDRSVTAMLVARRQSS